MYTNLTEVHVANAPMDIAKERIILKKTTDILMEGIIPKKTTDILMEGIILNPMIPNKKLSKWFHMIS